MAERVDITDQFFERLAHAHPTRPDDTPVLMGQTGHRATTDELLAVIAQAETEIAADPEPSPETCL